MKLGEIAQVTRGVSTGNRGIFIMSREKAKSCSLEAFVRPILGGARHFPVDGSSVVRETPEREVMLIVSQRDVEKHERLRAYLGEVKPVLSAPKVAPIAATYVGVPRFVANPDGLIITNALYCVNPRAQMTSEEIVSFVTRLNAAAVALRKTKFAERFTPRSLEEIELPD